MTSTNDGKDVKSNQASGQKGKTYFVELYKSLDGRLSGECELTDRTQHLCEAWRRVHSLCQHSAPTTHPHLVSWLQRHTARTILQTEWQSPKSKDEYTHLTEAIDSFIAECTAATEARNGVSPPWESQLRLRGEWFKKILANPWGHPVLRILLDPRGQQPTDDEILEWLKEERGVMFVTRLRQLAASKCDDLAMSLVTAVMDRVRATATLLLDVEQVDARDKPASTEGTFALVLRTEAGFTVEVWELVTDIEFVLLHKADRMSRCIELAKQTPLRDGYQLVERLQSRLENSPREKKLWKNAKEVATLIAQVIVARCMVIPICAGVARTALYCCARSLARLVPRTRLPAAAASLAAPAATARHLHTLAAAYDAQCSSDMKPFVCELYVRAITAGMNELERLKLKTEKNSEARSAEQTLCTWFTQLGSLLSASDRIKCECTLTAFSVHPSPAMYDRIKNAPTLPPVTVDDQDIKQETTSEFGSWATDSRTQTNLVKTSETLNIKQTQQQNVLSTAILTEGEGLGLSPELCMDLAVLLSGPRLKTLSWDMDRELLLDNCRTYLERTHGGTRALTTELKYLNLDPSSYQHLPEEDDDDENNAFYGIEKGYEHLVEIQEQDQLSPNAMFDYERTDTANSDIEITPPPSRRKKKTKNIVFSSDEETDPLSLVAETKKEKKKERPLSKERSKDRSASKEKKERKKKTKSTGDSAENKERSRERRKESADRKQKKEAKEKKPRKKKTKEILPVEGKSGSLSSLIGMKVSKVPAPDGKQKVPETKPAASVTDSDYDSQGKSSLASLNSEGNGPDVLFDGLFTDEYRSPEKADPLSERRSSFPNSEVSFAQGQMAINYQKSKANSKSLLKMSNPQTKPAQAVATVTSTPSPPKISDEVKRRLTGLVEYRKQAQRLSPFHTPPPPTPPPAMPPPSPHQSPATPIKSPNAIIQPVYPEQQIISPKAVEVPEIPKVYINKKQMDQIKVIREEVDVYLKSKFASKPVIQYASKLTNDSPQSTTQNVCLNLSTHQQDSSFPGPSQEQTKSAVSVMYKQNTSVKETGLSFHESYEKSLQDFLRELRETTNAGTGKCNNKTATNINKNIKTKKEIKKEAKTSSKESNVTSKVESTPSQCAKINNQGKKVETQLNTFARRSYMHRNKQNLESVNQEMLNRCIEEHTLAKLKSLQCSKVIISRTCNSTNSHKTNTDKDLVVIRKVEKTNVPQEHPVLMNILHGKANTSTESIVKNISLQPVKRKSTSTPKSLTESALSEKDQNDLLNLLRQQNKLNTHPAPVVNTDFTNINKIVNSLQCSKMNTATSSNYNTTVNKNVTVIKTHPIETCNNMYNIDQTYEYFKDRKISTPSQNMMSPNATDCKTATTNVPITSKNVDSLDNCSLNTYHNKIEAKHKEDQSKSCIAKADANGKEWQDVMNALLSHKTPSRGPSALDMALKKDPHANKNLRNQRIVRPNVISGTKTEHRVSNEKDKKQAITASHKPNAYSHQQQVKSSIPPIVPTHSTNINSIPSIVPTHSTNINSIPSIVPTHSTNINSIPSIVPSHSTNINLARLQQPSKLIESLPKKQSKNHKSEVDKLIKSCNQNATNKLLKEVCPQKSSPALPSSKQKTKNKRKQAISQNIAQPSCTKDENSRKDMPVHKNIVKKLLNVEKPKRITNVKKPCTTGLIQEKDPFISGISNSDYDLLEELMDDELRKEIGELSSDEDTYKVQTNSAKCNKIQNSTSCINVIKNAPMQQVKSNIPYTSNAPQSCRESIIQTSQIHVPCLNKPKVVSDIKLNNISLNQIVASNVKQYPKDCKTADFVASNPPACSTIIHQPLNTNVINRNIEKPPLVSSSHINVVDPRNVIITTIPQRQLQNVVLINSELVYDPYAALQTNVTNLHTGISNVNQTPYVTLESTPNITVFQTTQFAAPLVNPIIIGNAITAQAAPASLQEVPLDTSLAKSNEVDDSRKIHGLLELQERLPKANQHNHNIPSKPEIKTHNVSPHSNNQGLITSKECTKGAKTENVEVLKPINMSSDVAEKDNNTDKLSYDQKSESSLDTSVAQSNEVDDSRNIHGLLELQERLPKTNQQNHNIPSKPEIQTYNVSPHSNNQGLITSQEYSQGAKTENVEVLKPINMSSDVAEKDNNTDKLSHDQKSESSLDTSLAQSNEVDDSRNIHGLLELQERLPKTNQQNHNIPSKPEIQTYNVSPHSNNQGLITSQECRQGAKTENVEVLKPINMSSDLAEKDNNTDKLSHNQKSESSLDTSLAQSNEVDDSRNIHGLLELQERLPKTNQHNHNIPSKPEIKTYNVSPHSNNQGLITSKECTQAAKTENVEVLKPTNMSSDVSEKDNTDKLSYDRKSESSLDTSVAQSNEVDDSRIIHGLLELQERLPKTKQHNHNIPSKPEIQTYNVSPHSNNQGLITSQECRQGAKTENVEVLKPINMSSDLAEKDNNTDKLSHDQKSESLQRPTEINSISIEPSSQTCERKVLKEVQEKQKLKDNLHSSMQKTTIENDSIKTNKELETNVHESTLKETKQSVEELLSKESRKEIERLKRKRLRILSRVVNNRTNKPPIPLSYTPLVQKDISKETPKEIKRLDETKHKNSGSECPNKATERHTDSSKENNSNISTRRILLRSSNVIQSNVPDNKITKSHIKKTKTKRKDVTRLPSKDSLLIGQYVGNDKRNDNDHGKISNSPDKQSELLLKLETVKTPKKVAKLILKIPKKPIVSTKKGTNKKSPKRLKNKNKESKRSSKAKNIDTNLNFIDVEEALVGSKIEKKEVLLKNAKEIANVATSKKYEIHAPVESMSVEPLNRTSDSATRNVSLKEGTVNKSKEKTPGLRLKTNSGNTAKPLHSNLNTMAHNTHAESEVIACSTSLLKTPVNEKDSKSVFVKSVSANSSKLTDKYKLVCTPGEKAKEEIVSIQKPCRIIPQKEKQSESYVSTSVIRQGINKVGYKGISLNKNICNNEHNQRSSPIASKKILNCPKNELSVSSNNNFLPNKKVAESRKPDICENKNTLHNSLNYLKDKVTIEELPVEGQCENSDKKCVRIKLPNGKSFKATVYGKMHVSFESLFSEPSLKNALLSNLNTSRRYTLNVKQVSTQLADDPSKILGARIEEINLQPKGDAIETVNLLSDEEEGNNDEDIPTNRAEFDGYKILSPSEQLFEQHRTKLTQKCFVNLVQTKIKSKEVEKHSEMAPVIKICSVFKNTPLNEGAIVDMDSIMADKVKVVQTKREEVVNNAEVTPVIDLSSVAVNSHLNEEVFVDIDSVLTNKVSIMTDEFQSKSEEVVKNAEITPVIDLKSVGVNAPVNEEVFVNIDSVLADKVKVIQSKSEVVNDAKKTHVIDLTNVENATSNEEVHVDIDSVLTNNVSIVTDKVKVIQSESEEVVKNAETTPVIDLKSVGVNAPVNEEVFVNIDSVLADKVKVIQSKSEEVVNNADISHVIDLTNVVVNATSNEEVHGDIDLVLTNKVSIMTDKVKVVQSESEEVVKNAEIRPVIDLKSVGVNAPLNKEVFVNIDSVLADKVKVRQSKSEEVVNNAETTPVIDLTNVVVNASSNEEVHVDIDSVLADKVSKMEELKIIQIDNSLNDAHKCRINLFPSETKSEKVACIDEIAQVVDLISRAKNTEEDKVIEIDDSSNDSLDLLQDYSISPGQKPGGSNAKPEEKINELKNLLLKDLGVEENQEASHSITIDSQSCVSDDRNYDYVPIIKECFISLSRCDKLVKKYDQAKIINNKCIVKLVRCDDMIKIRNEDYHNKNLLASDEFIDVGFEDDHQSDTCILSRSGSFSILNDFMFYDQENIDESPNSSLDRNISSPVMDVFETIVALKKYSHVDKGRLGFLTETVHPLPCSCEIDKSPNSGFDRNISSPVMDVFETIVALKKYSHVDKGRPGFLTETVHPLPCSCEIDKSPNSGFDRNISSPVMDVFETIVALKKYSHVDKGRPGFLTKTDHPLPCSSERDESPNSSFDCGRSSPVMGVFDTIVELKKYSHVDIARHSFLIKTYHPVSCSSEWYKTKRETNLESKSVEIVFTKSDKRCSNSNNKSHLPKISIINEIPTLKTLTANYFRDITILNNYIMSGSPKAIYGITKKDAIESPTYKLKRKFKSSEFKSTDCKILRTVDNKSTLDVQIKSTHNITIDRTKPYYDDNNESSVVHSSILEIDKDMSICAFTEDDIQIADLSKNNEDTDNKFSSKLTDIVCCDDAKDKGISLTETNSEQPFYLTSVLSENQTLLDQNEMTRITADTSDIKQEVDRVKAELNGREFTKLLLNASVKEDLEQNEELAIEVTHNTGLKKINKDQLPITIQQPIECSSIAELANDSEQHKYTIEIENNSIDAIIHNTLRHPIALVSTICKEQSEISKDKADDMGLTEKKSVATLLNLDVNNAVNIPEDSAQNSPDGVILEEKDEKDMHFGMTNRNDMELAEDGSMTSLLNLEENRKVNMYENSPPNLPKVEPVDEINTIQNIQSAVTPEEIDEIDVHFNTTNEYDKESTENDSMKNLINFEENNTVNMNEHLPQNLPKVEPEDRSKSEQNVLSEVISKYPIKVNQLNKELSENNNTEIFLDSTIDISINNTKHRQDCIESNSANCDVNALEIEINCLEKSEIIDQTVPDLIGQRLVVTDDKCTTFNLSCEAISKETVNLFHELKNDENVEAPMLSVAKSNDENEIQCVDLVCANKLMQYPTSELLDHEYASPIREINMSPSCSEENLQRNLPADEIAEEFTDFETSIEDTYLDTLEEKLKNIERKEVTLVCKDRDDLVLTGIEYEDPVVGTCYVFPIIEETDDAEELIEVVQEIDNCEIIDTEESGLYDDYILEVNIPKVTYTRLKKRCTALKKFKLNNLKRKSDMNDEIYVGKRYRLEKKINNYPRGVTPANFVFGKEYKRVIDYCNSIKFSFSHPFVKDIIDVEDMLTNWPIKGVCANSDSITDNDETVELFRDDDNPQSNPTDEPFIDEISKNYNDLEPDLDTIDESNFNMGFGEGSDRVIQNLEEDGDDSKFSAATLSDVKQPQPFLLSEENDTKKELNGQEKHSDDQLKKLKHYITYIQLRDKVRSFFQKTSVELSMGFHNQEKELVFNNNISMKQKINCPFDLCLPDFIEPSPIEAVVQVVQVGQLPVSAAAQNPVTCDPRVTQVSDASPSQCSVDNSPQDDSQVTIKTEYTELTTADLTLPLVQEYAHHNQNLPMESENAPNMQMSNENIPIQTEIKSVVKIELEELPDVKEENRENFDNNEFQSDENKNDNVEFSFESNNTGNTSNLDSDSDFQNLFNASEKQIENETYTQKQQNGTSEKTDQIAHAMNAAGITTSTETMTSATRAHALVNILSQKLRQGAIGATQSAANTYPKTTAINAMALQQALAQILPPPLNQTNVSDNNQQSSNSQVTSQVLHIVQGKNTTGSQITLVDNSQQSVINNPNATPVLHIVQNKTGTNSANSNGTATPQANSFSGLSLVDAGLQQGGNQLLHIVNTGTQKNSNATGQLLKRVNLLTNLANVQGSNEQKMVQFVCKSADGKSIQLNAPHQRSMVLRLQPIETPNVTVQATPPKSSDNQDGSTNSSTNSLAGKDSNSQQEIKSRSVYEENYAKFIQNSSNKSTGSEKSTSLPKFNQAFGKPVFQDGNQKSETNSNSPHLTSVNNNNDTNECQSNDNAMNLDHISQISSPPLLLRKSPQTSQSQANLVQQLKQTIAPMNIQTMHGGVIYTRQIPVNIGGGQTINLITVPSTELIDDSGQKQQTGSQNEMEQSIIKIVPQTQNNCNTDLPTDENNAPISGSNENTQNAQPQPVLTQMRIKLPMLSKAPQMVSGARVVRPSFFQIQRNVIGGANQPVYQQLVLTAAPPLGQQTIRLPQTQASRPIKVPSENQSSAESQMSSSTLEQLREFDMVLEQVKERSTVQPGASATFPKLHTPSTDTTDSTSASSTSTESTQQVLYSIGNNQPLNVAYVNRKATVTTPTTSSFVRSPDSSGIVDSPTSSTHVQIPHTVTSETTQNESSQPKPAKVSSKSKSRPKASSNPPNTLKLNTVPPKTSAQKPLEDEQTTQRILYILAEYKEQVENSPDKDKPAPRRRSNPPSNPGSSKRKKSSSGSRRHGARDLSPVHGEDTCRTMGSEDSSCGTSQGDCNESCLESHSPQDSPRKVVRKLTFEQETPTTPQPRPQPQRNVIVADGQTITVARGTAGKPATAVLMPANYILPVSMVKGGQQIAIVTNRGPKLLTVGGGEGGATNALLLQRLIGPAGLKPVLARPGVRHVRLPTAALHNLQAFNLATTTTIQPPDSTASPAPAPTPPELVDTRANSSPWADRDMQDVKPERASSPEGSEPWNLPSSGDPHDYSYEETVRADNLDRTVLDPIPDRYSPDMEAQRIFDKMFDVESKKSYMGDSHDDSPRCGYDIDASDCDDKAYHQVVQKKDGSSHRQHRLTHVSAAALRHKYAILEHELRLQKSLSEECEDLGVDSPSASELFPEAELLFAASPAHDHTQDQGHHSHTPQPTLLNQSGIPQPDIDDQIATDQLLSRTDMSSSGHALGLGLGEGIVAVSEDMPPTIALNQEEFARAHPNTTFHSEPTDGEVQPFTIAGIKGRHITSTIFHSNRAPATVLMTTPQTTVISQATDNSVKYDIDNMINSLPSANNSNINLASVLVKDDGLTRFDNILSDSRELHLSNTASAIVHSAGNAAQVIRRVCYDEDKRDNRFLMDEPDALIAGDDAKMIAEDSSRDATMESMPGDVDDDRSSPERHAELFWESNSASASESRRPLDFSSDSEKCCKSPSYDETNSTDSSGVGTHMRLDSVIKEARGIERSGSADGSSADDTHPPLRTYPPKRMYHPLEGDVERSLSGKTRAGERSPDSIEVRRRASGRGVVKRGCHCCNGSPAPPRPKKSRQRKPTMEFNTN